VPAQARLPDAAASEERFLTLLVAQMRNQNPLEPLDNAQLTSQMAQIATVSGLERLQATLKALAEGIAESQSVAAASLIGREVLVPGATIELAGAEARAGFELAAPADRVVVTIRDAAGRAVHRAELGAHEAGVHAIAWDGRDDDGVARAPGTYTLHVGASRAGREVEAVALAAAPVRALTREANGIALELSGLGRRRYADVRQIL
jgi:flagellar basal-body rod modification protein FlgD